MRKLPQNRPLRVTSRSARRWASPYTRKESLNKDPVLQETANSLCEKASQRVYPLGSNSRKIRESTVVPSQGVRSAEAIGDPAQDEQACNR